MKREIAEIKAQFTPANCAITRIAGHIINSDKEQRASFNKIFLNLPEEEMFKYFDIFRKALSGKKGKNLYSLEFLEGAGSKVAFKYAADSKLEDEDIIEIITEKITDHYDYAGDYAIFIIHAAYDIPGKASDGKEMEDASEEVYEYIMSVICPVTLSKPGLSWDKTENKITNASRQWMVGMPDTAFIYPAFTNRSADYDHIWFYTKKPDEPDRGLIEAVLGCKMPVTPAQQKEQFIQTIKPKDSSIYRIETVKELFNSLQLLTADRNEEEITKEELLTIMKKAGIEPEDTKEDINIILQNVINLKTFEVATANAHITVQSEWTDDVNIREIDGESYVLVPAKGIVAANGLTVKEDEWTTE